MKGATDKENHTSNFTLLKFHFSVVFLLDRYMCNEVLDGIAIQKINKPSLTIRF